MGVGGWVGLLALPAVQPGCLSIRQEGATFRQASATSYAHCLVRLYVKEGTLSHCLTQPCSHSLGSFHLDRFPQARLPQDALKQLLATMRDKVGLRASTVGSLH